MEDIFDVLERYNLVDSERERILSRMKRATRFELNGHKCGAFTGSDGKTRYTDFETGYHGDMFDLIMKLENCTLKEAVKLAGHKLQSQSPKPSDWRSGILPPREISSETDIENIAAIRRNATRGKLLAGALNARGIDTAMLPEEIFSRLGFVNRCEVKSKSKGKPYRITGIAFDNGETIKIRKVEREGDGFSFTPKWGTKAISFGPMRLFNGAVLNGTDPVFITEGEMDALTIISYGYNAVSLPGASTANLLLYQLINSGKRPPLIIAVDKDEAGNTCYESLKKGLEKWFILYSCIDDYAGNKDINSWHMNDHSSCETAVTEAALKAVGKTRTYQDELNLG